MSTHRLRFRSRIRFAATVPSSNASSLEKVSNPSDSCCSSSSSVKVGSSSAMVIPLLGSARRQLPTDEWNQFGRLEPLRRPDQFGESPPAMAEHVDLLLVRPIEIGWLE